MENILLSTEIDLYVDTMKPHNLDDIGSKNWLDWHQRVQKLNQQAIIEASGLKEEHVKESLVMFEKIAVLVHEAVLIHIWKYKVFPILLRLEPEPPTTFMAYSILYHEAVCVALLELVMFHGNACETLGDSAADLLDYAYGAVSQLLVIESQEMELNEKVQVELTRQQNTLSFDIGIRCLSILRYLADYLERLPLGVTARMYTTNDVPALLTHILIQKPWLKNGKIYTDGQWKEIESEAVSTVEAQVWLALRQLLLDPACSTNYNVTDSRRSQFSRLQQLISPILLDQISILIELQQWLYYILVTDQPATSHKPILLEIVLEIRAKIVKQGEGKWKKIAKSQLAKIFTRDHKELVETAQSLSETYNTDLIEQFEQVKKATNTCAKCSKNAIQRCSRCKKEWYCGRNCQVEHWTEHKTQCAETENA